MLLSDLLFGLFSGLSSVLLLSAVLVFAEEVVMMYLLESAVCYLGNTCFRWLSLFCKKISADSVSGLLVLFVFQGALLVNIARGGLLDYEAILYHLKSGHLGGLGMDAAWTEPFDPEDPILKFPNVLIMPHVAAVTKHAFRSTAKVVGNVALQLHAGSPLTGIEFVN
ncbi:unnamed protein product [Camellia sinensis]